MALALAGAALASVDDFGLGDGHHGALRVRDAGTVINAYALLTADAGGTVLPVSSPSGFGPGDLVMVYQASDRISVDSGVPGPFDLTRTGAGRWELGRVAALDGGILLLSAPLDAGYTGGLTQVVLVPEYTAVTVEDGGSIVTVHWNGSVGGVVALLSRGAVWNFGSISADGAGFRGGKTNPSGGCSGGQPLDGPPGAGKGEGVAAGRYGPTVLARGNVVNGAGGGVPCNSGGGGGGNGGAGGKGGFAAQSTTDVGGLGGAALTYSPLDRMTFGGGGGAGENNQRQGGDGAPGGGIVFLRALELHGPGSISASGKNGADAGPINPTDGAGGGGAGGTVYVRVSRVAECGALVANGGDGGDTPEYQETGGPVGPGGGGGAGRILLQAADPSGCPVVARSGMGGIQPDTRWPTFFGATPDAGLPPLAGAITVIAEGFDAGLPEEGPPEDAGLQEDAGLPEVDAGTEADAGLVRLSVGCGCSSTGPAVFIVAVVLAMVAQLRRRSRSTAD